MELLIATPFYEVKGYSPYIVSLMQSVKVLNELNIKWDFIEISGDSYVDRAKNLLVHKFLKSDFSHLIIIDSDMWWNYEGFARMIKDALEGFEIIGAAYPCKNNWQFFGCIPHFNNDKLILGKELSDKNIRVLDMWGIPGGFIIYSKAAFERTRPNLDTFVDPNGEEILECFKCNIETKTIKKTPEDIRAMGHDELVEYAITISQAKKGVRIGEDIYFQQRYKEMGGIVWLEPNITMQHYGVKSWEGNYHDYLLNNIEAKESE
jgi:hypothetical protein